jgi:hypothetical protein
MVQKEKKFMQNSEMVFRIDLLRDPSIRWLFECRVSSLLQEVKISSDIEEWRNLTFILKQAASESIGTRKRWHRKIGVRKWDENREKVINEKRTAFKKYLQNTTHTRMRLNIKGNEKFRNEKFEKSTEKNGMNLSRI